MKFWFSFRNSARNFTNSVMSCPRVQPLCDGMKNRQTAHTLGEHVKRDKCVKYCDGDMTCNKY